MASTVVECGSKPFGELSNAVQLDGQLELGGFGRTVLGVANRDRDLLGDALCSARRLGVSQRAAHHARREQRLVVALSTRERSQFVFHRGVHALVPWSVLHQLCATSRIGVVVGSGDFVGHDFDRLYRLCVALGTNVSMGGYRDHQLGQRVAFGGNVHRRMALGIFQCGQPHSEPFLQLPLLVPILVGGVELGSLGGFAPIRIYQPSRNFCSNRLGGLLPLLLCEGLGRYLGFGRIRRLVGGVLPGSAGSP